MPPRGFAQNPYSVLGISVDADSKIIQAAYRRLARKHHPDVTGSHASGLKMQEINWAREELRSLRGRQYWKNQYLQELASSRNQSVPVKRPKTTIASRQYYPTSPPSTSIVQQILSIPLRFLLPILILIAGGIILLSILPFTTPYDPNATLPPSGRNYPHTQLSCLDCPNGIPIYDCWSADRKIVSFGKQGEECEVHQVYSTSYSHTLEPNASYKFIDYQPHLYLGCPTGHGFVYVSHTTYIVSNEK